MDVSLTTAKLLMSDPLHSYMVRSDYSEVRRASGCDENA